jgi:CheY-like chemotaxis protein
LDLEAAEFNFSALLEHAQKLWAPRAEEKGLAFQFQVRDDVPKWINNDATRLRQILFNLLSNAIKFTEHGQVTVSVRSKTTSPGRAKIVLTVADTGIGITEDQRKKLFSSFEQADGSITRRFGGTGLGLSISRNLSRLLGGDLTAGPNDRNCGSLFTLHFETELAAPKAADTNLSKASEVLKTPLKILAVEDNAINMKVLRALLHSFPFELIHAENGQIALDLLAAQPFDLVLMDVQMPVLDGVSATRRLRSEDGPNQNIPVIAMTANAMSGDRETCLQAGMSDYVPKPIDLRRLLAAIAKAGSLRKAKREPHMKSA